MEKLNVKSVVTNMNYNAKFKWFNPQNLTSVILVQVNTQGEKLLSIETLFYTLKKWIAIKPDGQTFLGLSQILVLRNIRKF